MVFVYPASLFPSYSLRALLPCDKSISFIWVRPYPTLPNSSTSQETAYDPNPGLFPQEASESITFSLRISKLIEWESRCSWPPAAMSREMVKPRGGETEPR